MSRPRIRTLKPEFFQDEKVNAVSRDARYLTIGLITRADDRGRQQNWDQAILGHVYPSGDVSLKQLQRWLTEIVASGIALAYERAPFSYLWLPNFWRHQKINRPSESDLPPHPDDSLASMPVTDAIKAFRGEHGMDPRSEPFSESCSDRLTPPRAGGRSAPFPSSSKTSSQGEDEVDARTLMDEACVILSAISSWDLGDPNVLAGVENAWASYPNMDLLEGCRLAVTWGSDPSWSMGCAATLRTALKRLSVEAKEAANGSRPRRESPSELLQAIEEATG